jgi:hypothetical protein
MKTMGGGSSRPCGSPASRPAQNPKCWPVSQNLCACRNASRAECLLSLPRLTRRAEGANLIHQRGEHLARPHQLVDIHARKRGVDLLQDAAALAVRNRNETDAEEHHVRHAQHVAQPFDRRERRRGDAALDLADHFRRNADAFGQRGLGQVPGLTLMAQIRPE